MLVNYIKNKEGRNLSKLSYKILLIIEQNGSFTSSELIKQLDYSRRAIYYCLKRLVERKILDKLVILEDMRKTRYMISETIILLANNDTNLINEVKISQF